MHTGRFIKRTFLYTMGDGLVSAVGLVLLPILTHYLTLAEYGTVALGKIIGGVATIVLSCGVPSAALKFHYEVEGDARKQMYSTLWLFLLAVAAVGLVVTGLFGADLFGYLFPELPYAPYVELALWAGFVDVAFIAIAREKLRAIGSAWTYLALRAAQGAGSVALVLLFVVLMKQGAAGAMRAHLGAFVVAGVVAMVVLTRGGSFEFRSPVIRRALVFGLPLVPHLLAHWVLSSADRFIIVRMVSVSEAGIYHLGYQIGSVALIVIVAGNSALIPVIGKLAKEDSAADESVGRIVTVYLAGSTAVAVGAAGVGGDVIRWLTAPQYHRAADIVPWLCAGFLFVALYSPAICIVNLLMHKTRQLAGVTVIAAATNVVLNILLIPRHGLVGAALATLLSYLLMFVGFALIASRGPKIAFEYQRGAIVLAVGVAAIIVLPSLPMLARFAAVVLVTGGLAALAKRSI